MNRIVPVSVVAFLLGLGLTTGTVLGRHRIKPELVPAALADSLGLSNDSLAALARRDSAGGDSLAPAAASLPLPRPAIPAPAEEATPVAAPASATPSAPATDEPKLDRQKLAKMYAAMSPKEAARVLEQMDDPEVQAILGELRDRQAAAILSAMAPARAAAITRLAIRANGGSQ